MQTENCLIDVSIKLQNQFAEIVKKIEIITEKQKQSIDAESV